MRFYEANATLRVSEGKMEQELTTEQRQNILRRTNAFLEEYEERACVFTVAMQKCIEVAICILDSDVNEKKLTEKYLACLEQEYDSLTLREISMSAFMSNARTAYRAHLISDDDEFMEGVGLGAFYNCHSGYYNDKIADDKKTIAGILDDVQKYHLSDSYGEELKRIVDGKKQSVFLGNPANYFFICKSAQMRRVMIRNMISALYKRGRLQSKRYTIVDLADDGCFLELLEELYDINKGATMYLRVSERNFPEGDQHRGALDMKNVCDIVKKKGSKTLTVFVMDTPSDKCRNRLENYMLGVPMVTFSENLYRGEAAKNILLDMAKAESFTISEELLEKTERSDRNYTYDALAELYNSWRAEYMGTEVFPEYKKYVTHLSEEEKQTNRSSAYKRLQEMIGLTQAKKVIDGAIDYFKLQQEYKKRGLVFDRPAMHMCFTGTPGTAKTSVARLVAEILKDNGILSEGRLVELGRSQLVGKYVGHTAPTVKEAFEKAKGSVLFIDEAYSLVEDRKGSYGTEAINTIVQEMENCREDTIVILAGYPEEMQQLLEWNPGMKSRIAFHVSFDDYTEQELLGITKLLAKDRGMRLDAGAEEKLLSIYAAARKDKAFGNGRFARNLLEKAKFNQANRFMKRDLAFVSDEEICTLVADDFDYEVKKEEPRRLGFGA